MHRKTPFATPLSLAVATLLCLSLSWGCGGGGSNDMSRRCIGFTAAATPAPGFVVGREGDSDCDVVDVEIVVNGVSDLFASNLTITFDPTVVRYDGVDVTGSVLGTDLLVSDVPGASAGERTIGVTRQGSSGVAVTGSGLLMTLVFSVPSSDPDAGSAALASSNEALLDSADPPQEIPGIDWRLGAIDVD